MIKSWLIAAAVLATAAACLARQPGISGTQYAQPSFAHAAFIGTNTCESCHETQRPAPIEGAVHGGGNDCLKCHTPKDDNSGWLPVNAFTHVPKPTTCLECHAADRPAPPHIVAMDCVYCHIYQNSSSFLPTLPGATDTSVATGTTTGTATGTSTGTSTGTATGNTSGTGTTSLQLQGNDGG